MKILHVIFSLGQGGAERFVLDLTNELAKTDEVYLIIIRDESNGNDFFKSELSSKVFYKCLGFRRGTKLTYLLEFFKLIREIKPDVVHSHLNTILYTLMPSIVFKKIKFFHTVHSDAAREVINFFSARIRKIFFRNNLIHPITISDESKASFRGFYGFDNSTLIYNGRTFPNETSKFHSVKIEIASLKTGPDHLVFTHVARFAPPKNQEMLIRVFNRLLDENEPLVLLVIGSEFDLDEASHLVESANEGIHFLGPKTNVSDYLLLSDAFCLSSSHEGMPISLIEALACECVPICTPVGGIVDIIENNKNGFLSANTSDEAYYSAVKSFIKYKDTIDRRLLRQLFDEKFSIKRCAEQYKGAYLM